ncbi:MAG: sulfotransferase, partial [Isosphaeraceae bacterium]
LGPNFAGSHVNLGDAYTLLGRHDEAREAYEAAVQVDPRFAAGHARMGASLIREERLVEAFEALTMATELAPNEPDHWRALGELYSSVEEYAPAFVCWRRVMDLSPQRNVSTHRALGWALQEENRLAEAEAEFRAAIALDPTSVESLVDLGFLLEENGDMAGAETCLRAAIRLNPAHGLANARLTSMLRRNLPDADFERTKALLEDPATPDTFKCSLHFSLGQAHDARGDHPAAARHLAAANALQLAKFRPHRRFSAEEHERFHDGLIRVFDHDFFARAAGAGLATRRPVFVVGLPRSGTSLVEQVLASHPQVLGAGELPLGRRMFLYLPIATGSEAEAVDCVPKLDTSTIRRLSVAYLNRLDAIAGTSRDRVVDKMPDNVMFLGLLVALFPNATVIHCRRDLRDVALSCWMSDFRSVFWCCDKDHIAKRFREYLRLMDHWREVIPSPIVDVDYEAMVTDLEGNTRRLLTAMGLDWHPNCLEFHRTDRPVRTSSATQVRQPLYTRSVGRWRHYEHELRDLFAAIPANPDRSE